MLKVDRRGTKRYCQIEACGLPFYDLARSEFACPNCGAPFNLQLAAPKPQGYQPSRYTKRLPNVAVVPTAPVGASAVPADLADVDDLTADVEVADDGVVAPEADTILETEDEELNEDSVGIPVREGGDED